MYEIYRDISMATRKTINYRLHWRSCEKYDKHVRNLYPFIHSTTHPFIHLFVYPRGEKISLESTKTICYIRWFWMAHVDFQCLDSSELCLPLMTTMMWIRTSFNSRAMLFFPFGAGNKNNNVNPFKWPLSLLFNVI